MTQPTRAQPPKGAGTSVAPKPSPGTPTRCRLGVRSVLCPITGFVAVWFAYAVQHRFLILHVGQVTFIVTGLVVMGLSAVSGLFLGVLAIRRIRRSHGRFIGRGWAWTGVVLSGALLALVSTVGVMLPGSLRRADSTAFMSNSIFLRTWVRTYAAQHQGRIPNPDSWHDMFKQDNALGEWTLGDPGCPESGRAFALNALLRDYPLTDVATPSRTVLLFECVPGAPPSGGQELLPPEARYRGAYLIVFCDGHTEYVPPEDLDRLIWNPKAEHEAETREAAPPANP